jgi:hypothetical protein
LLLAQVVEPALAQVVEPALAQVVEPALVDDASLPLLPVSQSSVGYPVYNVGQISAFA